MDQTLPPAVPNLPEPPVPQQGQDFQPQPDSKMIDDQSDSKHSNPTKLNTDEGSKEEKKTQQEKDTVMKPQDDERCCICLEGGELLHLIADLLFDFP
jgi:hypothetical protein